MTSLPVTVHYQILASCTARTVSQSSLCFQLLEKPADPSEELNKRNELDTRRAKKPADTLCEHSKHLKYIPQEKTGYYP